MTNSSDGTVKQFL